MLQSCVFWAVPKGRCRNTRHVASRLISALVLYGYAGRKCWEHSGRYVRIHSDVILEWANVRSEPKPTPVETAPSEWNVERKVVEFTLSRER